MVFAEIRDRPYSWTTPENRRPNNCYFKSVELLERLTSLGHTVRLRAGETCLDQRFPASARSLLPDDFVLTHVWVELVRAGDWHFLDPSFDSPLSRGGLEICEWESDVLSFEITKLYTQDEMNHHRQAWDNSFFDNGYVDAIAPCARALNKWFSSFRQ